MSISILDVLGIHEDDIDHAYEICEDMYEKLGLDNKLNDFDDKIEDDIPSAFSWDNPTNSFISCMFGILEGDIRDEFGNIPMSTYVNGWDSHFYITDEMAKVVLNADIEPALRCRILKSDLIYDIPLSTDQFDELLSGPECIIEDILNAVEHGESFTTYEDVEELGACNEDNGCRDEDDSDAMFGQFFIDAYDQGNSNEVYVEFGDGMVLSIPLCEEDRIKDTDEQEL